MSQPVSVSIIIPFQSENDYLRETVSHINQLRIRSVEIILLPDGPIPSDYVQNHLKTDLPLKIIETGPVSPAIKRDIGAENSEGEWLGFIDDDAYPEPGWLDRLDQVKNDDAVCAVGGPQITPESDSFSQKVSGAMFLSVLNGKAVERYWPINAHDAVDDWPSVNFIVKKDDFLSVGGFDSGYWPGEDTKLCHDLIQKGKKIRYDPEMIVFHHRRSGLLRHLKQVGNYGLHRGHFAVKYPETSLKPAYMIPSLFFLFVMGGWLMTLLPYFDKLYWGLWGLYGAAIGASIISITNKIKNPFIALSTIPFTVGTHFWYGYNFLKGSLFKRELKSKLGR